MPAKPQTNDYKVNWPAVFTLAAIVITIFTAGVLLGALINDEGTVSWLQALAWLGAGNLIGVALTVIAARGTGKADRDER